MNLTWGNQENIQKLKSSKFIPVKYHHYINSINSVLDIKMLQILFRMYRDKLSSLKKQLQQLKDGVHPEYSRKVKRLDTQYKERLLNHYHYLNTQ